MDIPHFVYPFKTDEHLDCSYFFAIMNSAAMYIHVQLFVPMFSILLVIYVGVELAGLNGNSMFNVLRLNKYMMPPAVNKHTLVW